MRPVALALLLVLPPAIAPSGAAVIPERTIDVSLEGDELVERESFRVALVESGDLDAWRVHAIPLDDGAEIEEIVAEVREGGKRVASVPRRQHERLESPGYDLYNSSWLHVVRFPPLSVGQEIFLETRIRHRPRYPSHALRLRAPVAQERLRVTVRAGTKLRFALRDRGTGLTVKEEGTSLSVDAVGVAASEDEALAPGPMEEGVLRFAWDGGASWSDVAAWYARFRGGTPGPPAPVESRARELARGAGGAREKVAALAGFVARQVRYEAVEIGAGGWIPTPMEQTLARGWGDCKDKSELLRGLLAAEGIPSHLALLHAGPELEVDPGFPTPDTFNHCILAVSATAALARDGDPVAGGWLFVDPTVERGGIGWLSPFDRGDRVLVVEGERGTLVAIPDASGSEVRELTVDGAIDAAGSLDARLVLVLRGRSAVGSIERLAREPAAATESAARELFAELLPAASLDGISAREEPGEVPTMTISARARQADVLRGEAMAPWLPLPALTALPGSRLLDDRVAPVLLQAGTSRTTWRLRAAGLAPEPAEGSVSSRVGRVSSTVHAGPQGEIVVEREVVVDRSRVEVADLPELRKIAAEESRAEKRRIVLRPIGSR